jgi:hypothetical protein
MDNRQAKLTSVDYLLVILTRLGLCPESNALKIYNFYRHRIFYKTRGIIES